jgi:molybdopterin converting factor small subunit
VSEQENVEEKASGAVVFMVEASKAYSDKAFIEAAMDFWTIPYEFSELLSIDNRIGWAFKAPLIRHLGYIEGITEALIKVRFFAIHGEKLNKPENVVEFATIMLRLKALYEDYKNGGKIEPAAMVETVLDIESDLDRFASSAIWELGRQE